MVNSDLYLAMDSTLVLKRAQGGYVALVIGDPETVETGQTRAVRLTIVSIHQGATDPRSATPPHSHSVYVPYTPTRQIPLGFRPHPISSYLPNKQKC